MEYGAADTPFLSALNAIGETPGPTRYLAIVNVDRSFVYISAQDGALPPVPAEDRNGAPHDFSRSARLAGAQTVELTNQGVHDSALLASHTGIVASPEAWQAAFDFLFVAASNRPGAAPLTTAASPFVSPPAAAPSTAAPSSLVLPPAAAEARKGSLASTGGSVTTALIGGLLTLLALAVRRAHRRWLATSASNSRLAV